MTLLCWGWPAFSQSDSTTRPLVQAERPAAIASTNSVDDLFVTPFLPPAQRRALPLDQPVTTQDGKATTLRALADRPLAISFAYSRCGNPNKCPRVVYTMGQLRQDLERSKLLGKTRLALITYDPENDTPAVMRAFAKANGYRLDADALFLRPAPDPDHRLYHDLDVGASFNDNGVALHRIQLLLIDKHGRLARSYQTMIWDNDQVVRDLQRLAAD